MATKLPTPEDGVDGLLGLAGSLSVSTQQLYRFLGYLRDSASAKLLAEARQILAVRMVAEQQRCDPDTEARLRVAIKLGYPADQRPNFYALLRKGEALNDERANPDWAGRPLPERTPLPSASDGVDGLLALQPTYELVPEDLFRFLGSPLGNAGAQIVGRTREILAARMVLARIRQHPGEDHKAAQRAVAQALGYPEFQRPNFYKRVARGLALLKERGET